jgi:DNA-damage-inducible protein J
MIFNAVLRRNNRSQAVDRKGAIIMPVSTGANTNINIRVASDIKDKAQDVFSALGLDMTSAVNIFLRQAIRKNGIPFELIAEKPQRKTRQFGRLKGKMWEADDHDWFEPLEDFKEYM